MCWVLGFFLLLCLGFLGVWFLVFLFVWVFLRKPPVCLFGFSLLNEKDFVEQSSE